MIRFIRGKINNSVIKRLEQIARALKNLRFHKSEPLSDKNKALLVQF